MDKEPEVDVIALCHAVRNERTVMIENFHTIVTNAAVSRALGPIDVADDAVSEFCKKQLLPTHVVNDEVVFELQTPFSRVLVVTLPRNQSGVTSSHLEKKNHRKCPKDDANG